jgi:hypothetical protein
MSTVVPCSDSANRMTGCAIAQPILKREVIRADDLIDRPWDRIAMFVPSILSILLVLQRTNRDCLKNITVPRVGATDRLWSFAL